MTTKAPLWSLKQAEFQWICYAGKRLQLNLLHITVIEISKINRNNRNASILLTLSSIFNWLFVHSLSMCYQHYKHCSCCHHFLEATSKHSNPKQTNTKISACFLPSIQLKTNISCQNLTIKALHKTFWFSCLFLVAEKCDRENI